MLTPKPDLRKWPNTKTPQTLNPKPTLSQKNEEGLAKTSILEAHQLLSKLLKRGGGVHVNRDYIGFRGVIWVII